jgi:hypothetical protein
MIPNFEITYTPGPKFAMFSRTYRLSPLMTAEVHARLFDFFVLYSEEVSSCRTTARHVA